VAVGSLNLAGGSRELAPPVGRLGLIPAKSPPRQSSASLFGTRLARHARIDLAAIETPGSAPYEGYLSQLAPHYPSGRFLLFLLGLDGTTEDVFSMCDYSLHNVKSRHAKVGNRLTTRNFNRQPVCCGANGETEIGFRNSCPPSTRHDDQPALKF